MTSSYDCDILFWLWTCVQQTCGHLVYILHNFSSLVFTYKIKQVSVSDGETLLSLHCSVSILYCSYLSFFSLQYAAKEYQQALDILDIEEPASKKLLDKGLKEESGTRETTKEWEMSPASVSTSYDLYLNVIRLKKSACYQEPSTLYTFPW